MVSLVIGEHVLVGYVDDAGGREALALAKAIAEVTGARLTVGTIHPPERAGSGIEALTTLDNAAELLEGQPADFVTQESRGASRGHSGLTFK